MFSEFKNNKGFLSTQYYTLFLFRRLLFLIAQVCINDALFVQASLNIVCALVQVLYLIKYRPFVDSLSSASIIGGEIITTIIFILSTVFLFNIDQNNSDLLTMVIMFIMLTSLGYQFVCSIISAIISIKQFWSKGFLARGRAFIKVAPNINKVQEEIPKNITTQEPEVIEFDCD